MSLDVNLRDLATAIGTGEKQVRQWLNGNMTDLSTLTTTAKTSLVAAINELDSAIDTLSSAEGGATINDGATSGSQVWSSLKTNTEIATAIAALVDSAPGTLNTLNEIAAALQDDPAVITALQTSVGNRVRFDAAQTLTGPQQTQARSNIGAGTSNFSGAYGDLSGKPTLGTAAAAATADFATAAQGALAANAVPQTRTVNAKALTSNISLTAADVGAASATDVGPTSTDYVAIYNTAKA